MKEDDLKFWDILQKFVKKLFWIPLPPHGRLCTVSIIVHSVETKLVTTVNQEIFDIKIFHQKFFLPHHIFVASKLV